MARLVKLEDSILVSQLNSKNPQLASSLQTCWEEAAKLLRHVAAMHPHHTSHGPDHAMALLDILGRAISPVDNLELTEGELYILLAGTLLHDIGMVGRAGASEEIRKTRREEHHTESRTYIREHSEVLSLDSAYVLAIADVAAAHRKLNIEKYIESRRIESEQPRIKLCAALLRMADECHITVDRVPRDFQTLELPEESAKHFSAHLNTSELAFNANGGTIEFSVRINSEDMDTFFKAAKEKIQKELLSLRPIFEREGIPYREVIFVQDREDLVCKKIIVSLLRHETRTIQQLVTDTDEQETDLVRWAQLSTSVDCTSNSSGETLCRLHDSESSFDRLAEDYLSSGKPPEYSLLFSRSSLVKHTLTDEYLDNIVGKCIGAADPKHVMYRMIRLSPSALRFVLENAKRMQPRGVFGGGGIWNSLLGEVLEDFAALPELLLEPGFVDEVFDEGNRNPDEWNIWKIRQVREYNKAFDLEKLVEQWVVPNEWERRVQGLDDDKAPPISFSLDFRFDSPGLAMHPAEIMASANKLGMPYELSASPGVNIQVRGEGLPPELVSNKNVLTSFRVDAPKNQWSIDGFLPGQIETRGDDVILIPQYGAESADMDWSCPLTFSLRRGAAIKGQALDETMVQIDWTMTLNLPEMDCQEVWALVKPLRESSGRVLILSPPGSETEYVDISENCSARPLLELSPEVVDTIEKLTTLQQYLGNRILFPLAGLPDVIGNLLLSSTVSSETEARELWNKIEKSTENDFTRPTITILTFEGQESSRLQWRRFSWIHRGHRYPKTSVTFDESAPEDAGRSFTESMEDPSKAIAIQKPLRLSRIAAVEYMEQNPIDMGDVHLPWPWKLKDFFGRSVEEFRTLLVMEWKPVEERRWCRVSPVKCILAELTKSERWLQEGRHSSDAGDLPRAYLAAKEAHRCNPESPIVNMNVGWYAFLLKRIVEAKRYTEKYWSFNEENTRAIAGFNMCVFALEEMRSSDDGPEQAKGQFLEWLETTLDSFVDVPAKTKEQSVNAFIGDLEELFQDQPPTAVDVGGIIDALTKLRNISLTCNKCST